MGKVASRRRVSTLTRSQSVAKTLSKTVSSVMSDHRSPASPGSATSPASPASPGSPSSEAADWRRSRVAELAFEISNEISNSFQPFKLRRWVSSALPAVANGETGSKQQNQSTLPDLFNLAVHLGPVASDYADIGAYSKSASARLYNQIVEQVPRLVLAASFGNEHVAANMRMFMMQLLAAEQSIGDKELSIINVIVKKDRGPFLYWLLNERASLCTFDSG